MNKHGRQVFGDFGAPNIFEGLNSYDKKRSAKREKRTRNSDVERETTPEKKRVS